MRGFDDVLREGFDRHARALAAAGGIGKRAAQAAVGVIRRRRRIRAYTTGVVSVVAIAGLAVGASAVLPIHRQPDPVGPGGYPWCDVSTYPVPNPGAYSEYYPYEGRVYADFEEMRFVYVAPDGRQEVLQPDQDGSYSIVTSGGQNYTLLGSEGGQMMPPWTPLAYDLWDAGDGLAAAGHPYLDDPEGLRLGFEWTTTVPNSAPEGVSVSSLAMVHLPSIGFGGVGLTPSAVPPGAVVQTVVRWTDGREDVSDIPWDRVGEPIAFFVGLESVTTRVSNLPDGEVFEIVSTYDPTMTWAAACTGPSPTVGEPSPIPTPVVGAYPWCDLSTYPAPNPEAYGEYYPYLGRVYEDYKEILFVYVAPDGSHEVIEPDADGTYVVTTFDGQQFPLYNPEYPDINTWTHIALDFFGDGGASGNPYLESPYGPGLAYEWTTVVPDEVPAGVSVRTLSEVHGLSIGFGGTGLTKSAVPNGAVVQTVVRWTDGREQVVDIGWDESGASVRDYTDIASISLRVSNLPDGEVFEITSYYDPTKTWAAACGPLPIEPREPEPDVSEMHYGPYLEGPEAEVFQCLTPLPSALEDAIPATVEPGVGEEYASEHALYFDYGTGGVKITSTIDLTTVTGDRPPMYPGWSSSWSAEDDGSHVGATVFHALAWVNEDGVIIGRETAERDESPVVVPSHYSSGLWMGARNGHETFIEVQGYLAERGLPCDGVDSEGLEEASIVFIQGFGPSADQMTWSWTRLTESS
ncbi:MAG: hypothetical protein JW722_00180 [Demequinaceae bacterium]|nr:hypothetical protein [Demequinaceae bacterium]